MYLIAPPGHPLSALQCGEPDQRTGPCCSLCLLWLRPSHSGCQWPRFRFRVWTQNEALFLLLLYPLTPFLSLIVMSLSTVTGLGYSPQRKSAHNSHFYEDHLALFDFLWVLSYSSPGALLVGDSAQFVWDALVQCFSLPKAACPVLVTVWRWCPPLSLCQQTPAGGICWRLKDRTVADVEALGWCRCCTASYCNMQMQKIVLAIYYNSCNICLELLYFNVIGFLLWGIPFPVKRIILHKLEPYILPFCPQFRQLLMLSAASPTWPLC